MWSIALLQCGGMLLRPRIDGRMIDVQTPLLHDLFEISRAERIPEVPTDAQQNDLTCEMTPFERSCVVIVLLFSSFDRIFSDEFCFCNTAPPATLQSCKQVGQFRR